jgi:hypothetical protein
MKQEIKISCFIPKMRTVSTDLDDVCMELRCTYLEEEKINFTLMSVCSTEYFALLVYYEKYIN